MDMNRSQLGKMIAKVMLNRIKINGDSSIPTIEVPVKKAKICKLCNGTGKKDKVQCKTCNGLGKILHPNDNVRLRTGLYYKYTRENV